MPLAIHCPANSRAHVLAVSAVLKCAVLAMLIGCEKRDEVAMKHEHQTDQARATRRPSISDRPSEDTRGQASRSTVRAITVKHKSTQKMAQAPDYTIQINKVPRDGLEGMDLSIDGTSMPNMPYWKRVKVSEIQEKRKIILDERERILTSDSKQSPAKRRELVREWAKNHYRELRELEIGELKAQRSENPGIPAESEVKALNQKLNAENAVFTEADMLPLEYLIPSLNDLTTRHLGQDVVLSRMIEIYQNLARYFPRSVMRPELLTATDPVFQP